MPNRPPSDPSSSPPGDPLPSPGSMPDLNQSVEEDLALDAVKHRAVRATSGLIGRQLVLRVIDFGGMIVLARVLTPEMFGIFAIARFVVYFFQRFSDFGLSATLLRKPDAVTEAELRTVFTIQQSIVVVSLAVILLAAPAIVQYYELEASYAWLLRVLGLSLVLASLKTIPSVLIQRQLRHEKLAVIDVVEVIAYQAVTVTLAVLGFEVWALVWGTLARGVTGLLMIFRLAWWRPAFGFHRAAAREVLTFGVPVQLSSFASLAENSVVPVIVGSILGAPAVGFTNWARSMMGSAVGQPLILMGKVQMRVFGRVQEEKKRLARAIERNIFLGGTIVCLSMALLVALAKPFVLYVILPKWLPALPVLYVLAFGFALRIVGNPYMQALKALGKGWATFVNVFLMFIVEAIVILALASRLGIVSYGIALTLAQATMTFHAVHRVHREVRPRWFHALWPPALAASVACAAMFGLVELIPGAWSMPVGGLVGSVLYVLVLSVLAGDRLGADVRDVLGSMGRKSERLQALAETGERLFQGIHARARFTRPPQPA